MNNTVEESDLLHENELEGLDDGEEESEEEEDEFVCQSCFLVKHRTQLADPGQSLCRDCANNART